MKVELTIADWSDLHYLVGWLQGAGFKDSNAYKKLTAITRRLDKQLGLPEVQAEGDGGPTRSVHQETAGRG